MPPTRQNLRGFLAACFVSCWLPATPAWAALLTLGFSGDLFSASANSPHAVGAPFSGSLTYTRTGSFLGGEGSMRAVYEFDEPGVGVSFAVGATQVDHAFVPGDTLWLDVRDDFETSCVGVPLPCPLVPTFDQYAFAFVDGLGPLLNVVFGNPFSMPLDLSAIQGLAVPTLQSDFADLSFAAATYHDQVGGWSISGSIRAFSLVPEPAGGLLLGVGLLALRRTRLSG